MQVIGFDVLQGRSRVKRKKGDDTSWDWDVEKLEAISILKNLIVLPLNRLWNPSVIEEEFLK